MPLYFFKDPRKNEKQSLLQHLTLVIPLKKLTKTKILKLKYMQREFNRCAAFFLEQSQKLNTTSPYKLHKLCNAIARQKFKLGSAVIQTARDRGIAMQRIFWAKVRKRKHTTRPVINGQLPIQLRQDVYTVFQTPAGAWMIKFLLLPGRKNHLVLPLIVRPYILKYLKNQSFLPGPAEIYPRGKNWLISMTIKIPYQIKPSSNMIGVDLGIAHNAVLSTGQFLSRKYLYNTYKLQVSKTLNEQKSGRRKHMFISYINHLISRDIIKIAQNRQANLALEDLTGIKERVLKQDKYFINSLFKWTYRQLLDFIQYKATLAGIKTLIINPAHTSLTCSRCGHIDGDNRLTQSIFKCKSCGSEINADLNAARVIAKRGSEDNEQNKLQDIIAANQTITGGN
ncbi:MAG: transposase [Elusimicrobiota bacterium]